MINETRQEFLTRKVIKEPMELVKRFDSMGQKLRKDLNIPLKQPLLDYAFGGKHLFPEHRVLLAQCLNIYDQGYDFADMDWYYGFDIVKPKGNNWRLIEDNGLWLALNIEVPAWLKEKYEERCRERKEAMRRKELGIKQV